MKKTTQHFRLILIGVQGVATINVSPNIKATAAATIGMPDTPQRPMLVGEEDIIGTL